MKIKNSKGELYIVCPFLEKISFLAEPYLPSEEMFELQAHLEAIREIAKVWQSKLNLELYSGELEPEYSVERIAQPYNYGVVLKRIRALVEYGALTTERFDEIINLYK